MKKTDSIMKKKYIIPSQRVAAIEAEDLLAQSPNLTMRLIRGDDEEVYIDNLDEVMVKENHSIWDDEW